MRPRTASRSPGRDRETGAPTSMGVAAGRVRRPPWMRPRIGSPPVADSQGRGRERFSAGPPWVRTGRISAGPMDEEVGRRRREEVGCGRGRGRVVAGRLEHGSSPPSSGAGRCRPPTGTNFLSLFAGGARKTPWPRGRADRWLLRRMRAGKRGSHK
jgi:hypothetical protein